MTLPRLKIGRFGPDGLSVAPYAPPPKSAPAVSSDNRNHHPQSPSEHSVFNYSKTFSRSDSKVTLRRRSSAKRKSRTSVVLVGGSVRDNGDYFKELLSDAEYLCTSFFCVCVCAQQCAQPLE